jgi:hypothetical protein
VKAVNAKVAAKNAYNIKDHIEYGFVSRQILRLAADFGTCIRLQGMKNKQTDRQTDLKRC